MTREELVGAQAAFAGAALIGLMADPNNMNNAEKNKKAAWDVGDLMAAEFMRRLEEPEVRSKS